MNKITELEDVSSLFEDGMTIGIGGFGAQRKPMSLIRKLCESGVQDLTVVTYGGPEVGMLLANGQVSRLLFTFVTLDSITLDPTFRAAREQGGLEVVEYDEGMLWWALYAAQL